MNDNGAIYKIGKLSETASANNIKNDENKDPIRNRKKSLIKVGSMCVLTLAMFIFSTMHMITKQMTAETA